MTTNGALAPTPGGGPVLRWSSRARSIEAIELELSRIWAQPDLTAETEEGGPGRHVAARTSVMNLVVIARRPEVGERCASIISQLTGRHPSRTLVIHSADPDGPSWVDARIQALCVLPGEGTAEMCAEFIDLSAGGEAGRHLHAVVAPLLIHDLPVTIWWAGDPTFGSPQSRALLALGDRLVVDGSTWSGDGLDRLGLMAGLLERPGLAVTDFALTRQSRWREAIASIFDLPEFLPYLHSLRRIAVTYATHDEAGAPGGTNAVKPVYHVAWLASRLGLEVVRPLAPIRDRGRSGSKPAGARHGPGAGHPPGVPHPAASRGLAALLKGSGGEVGVIVRPVVSPAPAGTTLRVELLAARRGAELRVDVTAEAESVVVHAWEDGVEVLHRAFQAPRRTELELLGEAIEAVGPDPVAAATVEMAAALARPDDGRDGGT